MKATVIVRRIDDLGRVVIPKEIRRTMRIRKGGPSPQRHWNLEAIRHFHAAFRRKDGLRAVHNGGYTDHISYCFFW